MSMFQSIGVASDRVMTALIAGLEIEFGQGVGAALARRFLAAEESEFLWEARVAECWLGSYRGGDDEEGIELDRVGIIGTLDGDWFVATSIVDGEGVAHGLMGRRSVAGEQQAWETFAQLR